MLDQERTQLQQALHFAPNRPHCFLERLTGQGAIADPMPQGKEPLDLVQQQTTDKGRVATPVYQSLEIATQMRPAELALLVRESIVSTGPVGTDDAGIVRTKQVGELLPSATGAQEKDGHVRRTAYPQPTRLIGFFPARFIDVNRWCCRTKVCAASTGWASAWLRRCSCAGIVPKPTSTRNKVANSSCVSRRLTPNRPLK